MPLLGILFSLVALVAWGFGDFAIQRATRLVGVAKALFFIGVVGAALLTPFVWREFRLLSEDPKSLALLLTVAAIAVVGAPLYFEALRRGKISAVEPLLGLELPITVFLSVLLAGERLSFGESLLILIVFIGIVLAVTKPGAHAGIRTFFERGALLGAASAVTMGFSNTLVGISSREVAPLLTVWAGHAAVALECGIILLLRGKLSTLLSDLRRYPGTIAAEGLLDVVAWAGYAIATTHIPIAIATTVSESYIALAVLLGILVNRERLRRYQLAGVLLAITGVLVLSAITSAGG